MVGKLAKGRRQVCRKIGKLRGNMANRSRPGRSREGRFVGTLCPTGFRIQNQLPSGLHSRREIKMLNISRLARIRTSIATSKADGPESLSYGTFRIHPSTGRRRPAVYLFGVGDAARPYRSGHRAAGHRPLLAMAFQVTFRAIARRYLHHARELQLPLPVDDEPVGVVAADFVAMDVAEVNPSWRGSESTPG